MAQFTDRPEIDRNLISKGVQNLNEFGYPDANVTNIMTDPVFSKFFVGMLDDNEGQRDDVDEAIERLRTEIKSPTQEPKYRFEGGRVINRASGEAIPLDEPVMVFRGRDHNARATIEFYQSLCADAEHRDVVEGRIEDFRRFAEENPDSMKEPDTEGKG